VPFSLGKCKGITDSGAALLVQACKGNATLKDFEKEQIWIPHSVLDDENECEEFEEGEVFVRTWWAERQGLA